MGEGQSGKGDRVLAASAPSPPPDDMCARRRSVDRRIAQKQGRGHAAFALRMSTHHWLEPCRHLQTPALAGEPPPPLTRFQLWTHRWQEPRCSHTPGPHSLAVEHPPLAGAAPVAAGAEAVGAQGRCVPLALQVRVLRTHVGSGWDGWCVRVCVRASCVWVGGRAWKADGGAGEG